MKSEMKWYTSLIYTFCFFLLVVVVVSASIGIGYLFSLAPKTVAIVGGFFIVWWIIHISFNDDGIDL